MGGSPTRFEVMVGKWLDFRSRAVVVFGVLVACCCTVSYTHLTLPTIYSV